MKSNTLNLLLAFTSLSLGVLLYFTTRSDGLYVNQWLASLGFNPVKVFLTAIFPLSSIPQWIRYSLPDGLWMLALMLLILMIWNFKVDTKSLPWIVGAGLAGLLFEIGQSLHLVPGTFDAIDLIGVCIGALLPFLFVLLKPRICDLN